MKLETEVIKLSDIKLDPDNVRKHSGKNLEAIKQSLRRFGQVKPVVLDQGLTVVAGNGTVTAAKDLGWNQIEAVKIPEDWDDKKIKAYAIADNRTAELAEWNTELLAIQLEELKDYGYELEDTGFSKLELSNLIRLSESQKNGSTDPYKEWVNMPEYDSEDMNAAFRVVIKFANEIDADDFFNLIKRPKKSSLWWPQEDGFVGSSVKEQYIAED
jgi:hypothetical protein